MSKLVFVTGAGRGIGRAIALRLCGEGYVVSGCSRTLAELDEARAQSRGALRAAQVDVTRLESVEKWMKAELAAVPDATPWGLVAAAGVHGQISPFLETDWRQWHAGFEVNLFGAAHCAFVFARHLAAAGGLPGRIAILSGGGATKAIENMTSYCASKAAVVRFAETLARELEAKGITVNTIAPGAVNTALTKTIIEAGPAKAGKGLYEQTQKQLKEGGQSPDKAAALACYLMSDASAPVTGRLISAVWDDWAKLHEHPTLLADRDLFTLRRKAPT